MNGFEYIARILKDEGIEWMSCFPSNPLIEAVAKEGIRPIAFRHERGAVMAADGYSRLSDRSRFGVVAMQSQAGAENAMGGLAQANADNIPILVLPEGNPLALVNVRPNFFATKSWETVCKSAEFIGQVEQTGNIMRRAFHGLRNGRPGPVVVEMPADVCEEALDPSAMNYTSPSYSLHQPSSADINEAVSLLVNAKNPLIWAGAGVMFAGATQALLALAELLDIPVYTSMPGKSAFDERHPLSVGCGGLTVTRAGRQWLDDCDVLFAIGTSLTQTFYGQSIPDGKCVIHGVLNPGEINKDTAATVGLVGDAKLTLEQLLDETRGRIGEHGRTTGVRERVAAVKDEWLGKWNPYLVDDGDVISPYRIIHELNETLDLENSIVTHDAGAPRDQIVPFFTATVPHSYIGWGKTTHLGFSIPLMIGAKLAKPDKFCLNLMGDAAFGMSGLDIETSARAGVPITTIVMNNGGMATYPGGFPTAREKFGVSRMQGDYAALADAMGAVGITVKKTGEIVPALKKAQQLNTDGKTVLLDMHTRHEDSRAPDTFA
jgi:thiamine pyrophosphate-dependent acetolactate synthase large subunit-like protein